MIRESALRRFPRHFRHRFVVVAAGKTAQFRLAAALAEAGRPKSTVDDERSARGVGTVTVPGPRGRASIKHTLIRIWHLRRRIVIYLGVATRHRVRPREAQASDQSHRGDYLALRRSCSSIASTTLATHMPDDNNLTGLGSQGGSEGSRLSPNSSGEATTAGPKTGRRVDRPFLKRLSSVFQRLRRGLSNVFQRLRRGLSGCPINGWSAKCRGRGKGQGQACKTDQRRIKKAGIHERRTLGRGMCANPEPPHCKDCQCYRQAPAGIGR